MIQQRGVRSVKISEVKGHADDDMVAVGRVRVEDQVGNDLADRAADFGRRTVSACSSWYPVILDLHRFFIAIARAAVNEDGCAGVALHLTVWSSGGLVKRRKVRLSAWEYAWVPGPVGLWRHGSFSWPRIEVRDVDVGFWPYSVGLLVKLCSFLSSLHWPSTVDDLRSGVFRSLSSSSFTNGGLVRGWCWRCRLLRFVVSSNFSVGCSYRTEHVIFGDHVGFWVRCFVL